MRFLFIALAIVTAQVGPSLPASGPAGFDIAGVRLGMTPADARLALTNAGYRISNVAQLESFQRQVASRIAQARHGDLSTKYEAIASFDATGPATERVGIEFAQWPDGPHAITITFMGNPERQPQDAFRQQVEGRFGKPTMHVIGNWRWCSAGEKQCGPVANPTMPTLDADYQSRALTLKVGGDTTQARKDLVEAAAREVVPLQSGSAF